MRLRTQVGVALLSMFLVVAATGQQRRPSPKPGAKAPTRLTGVHLTVDPPMKNYRGACPVRVVFNGDISTNGPATVPYTFEASNGQGFTGHRLEFSAPGKKSVQQVWEIRQNFSGWLALKPEAPFNTMSSTRAFFHVTCTGRAPRS